MSLLAVVLSPDLSGLSHTRVACRGAAACASMYAPRASATQRDASRCRWGAPGGVLPRHQCKKGLVEFLRKSFQRHSCGGVTAAACMNVSYLYPPRDIMAFLSHDFAPGRRRARGMSTTHAYVKHHMNFAVLSTRKGSVNHNRG
jgi:hypothetical protein